MVFPMAEAQHPKPPGEPEHHEIFVLVTMPTADIPAHSEFTILHGIQFSIVPANKIIGSIDTPFAGSLVVRLRERCMKSYGFVTSDG